MDGGKVEKGGKERDEGWRGDEGGGDEEGGIMILDVEMVDGRKGGVGVYSI